MSFAQVKQYLFNNLLWGENGTPKNRPFSYAIPLLMPDASRIWGIDISHWNRPPVNLARMKELYGLKFVIIKGCDGSIRSRYSAEHVAAAKEAGLPWGFYDWLYPNSKVSIAAQTDAWVAQAKEFEPPMGISIDAEWTNYAGAPANPSASDLRVSHDMVKNKYGKSAMTYTAKGYADVYLRGFDFSREPLWVASYGGTNPLMPIGANNYRIWQFASTLDGHQLDPNGNAELDGNYFNGGVSEFQFLYGETEIPPEPETGEQMFYGRNKTTQTNIRALPSATSRDLGDLYLNDTVEADGKDATGVWWHLTKITRADGTVFPLPAAECWAWGVNIEPIAAPPAAVYPVSAEVKMSDGSVWTGNFTRA